ncbi:MAG: TIM barrel protein [Candidatus Poribacteria bacterium]|nr:TIM barrel protein [Candidatus Poribacteria bacterium]
MSTIKQSVVWWCAARGGIDHADLIKRAAKMGYSSVEMSGPDVWPLIHDAGMEIAIVGGHGTLTNGLNKPENHDRIEDELSKNIEIAAQNRIPSLIAFSGNRNGLPDDEGIDICAEGLNRVKKLAEEKNIVVCVELLNSKADHPDYQCDHTAWGVELCKKVDSPNVKLLYDIYHMQIMEGDLIRTIRENIDHIGHFHTAGNPGRNDMDETQEIYYPPIMRAVAETDYDGYVGHEFIPKGDLFSALQAAHDLCAV